MSRVLRTAVGVLVCCALLATVARAQHDDAEIDAVIARYHEQWSQLERGEALADDVDRLRRGALQGLDVGQLTIRQLARLSWLNVLEHEAHREAVLQRVAAFDDDPGPDGAGAAVLRLRIEGTGRHDSDVSRPLLDAVLHHPALRVAVVSGHAEGVFEAIDDHTTLAQKKDHAELILGLEQLVLPGLSSSAAISVFSFTSDVLEHLEDDEAVHKRWRKKTLDALWFARGQLTGESAQADTERMALDHAIGQLEGAAGRGELVGHPAPAIEFSWASREGLSSLEDLRGKVVVLDFWTTWCGPCVGSFDDLRELQARYADSPVEIVGVTSLQGSVDDESSGGDPAREYALMAAYIEAKNITWTIAFSEQDVFNPDYGVTGIPYVAIIDPDGKVVASDVPFDPAARIDALLAQHGLPVPVAPR